MDVRNFNLPGNQVRKKWEEWFKPILNIHSPSDPTITPILYLLLFNSIIKKMLFLG